MLHINKNTFISHHIRSTCCVQGDFLLSLADQIIADLDLLLKQVNRARLFDLCQQKCGADSYNPAATGQPAVLGPMGMSRTMAMERTECAVAWSMQAHVAMFEILSFVIYPKGDGGKAGGDYRY